MSPYTRLEQAVMAALVQDLRAEIPDLAGQFGASRPSQRRNTGFGLFTETLIGRDRPAPASGPTGDLGTVHAMVAHLRDPIAFRVRVRNGVLLGLLGDSYGQDTRSIDFATAHFDQVFTVDAHGRSIPFESAGLAPSSSQPDRRPHSDARSATIAQPAPPRTLDPGRKPQTVDRPAPVSVTRTTAPSSAPRPQDLIMDQLFGAKRPGSSPDPVAAPDPDPAFSDGEKTALRVGLWFALFVLAGVLVLIFDMSIVFVFIVAVMAGRFLQTDNGLKLIKRGVDEWKKAQANRPAS